MVAEESPAPIDRSRFLALVDRLPRMQPSEGARTRPPLLPASSEVSPAAAGRRGHEARHGDGGAVGITQGARAVGGVRAPWAWTTTPPPHD
jgi:hypothetical protein